MFAEAIQAALLADAAPRADAPAYPTIPAPLDAIGAPFFSPAPVTAAAIDLRHERWPDSMIERIEALRDAGEATSTRVRVSPDALGPVELTVRREGERLHVHFNAAQPETRALLLDAQPRLTELAAERGLKLGQTSVGGGAAQDGAAGGRQRQPAAPARAVPSRARAETDQPDTQDRLA